MHEIPRPHKIHKWPSQGFGLRPTGGWTLDIGYYDYDEHSNESQGGQGPWSTRNAGDSYTVCAIMYVYIYSIVYIYIQYSIYIYTYTV